MWEVAIRLSSPGKQKKGVGVKPTPIQEQMMLTWLTPELDQDIREYATYLSPDDGEDGYHNAIEHCLRLHVPRPNKPQAFLRTATKRAIFKLWRHRTSDAGQSGRYLRGEAPDCTVALHKGRQVHTHCRRGHEFTQDNIVYAGKNHTVRTCKTCRLQSKQSKEFKSC